MMGHQRRAWMLIAALAVVIVWSAAATAQTAATQPAVTPVVQAATQPAAKSADDKVSCDRETLYTGDKTSAQSAEDWIKASKNPVPWLKLGGDARLRNEWDTDVGTLNKNVVNHERNVQRYRLRLWDTITPIENVDINTRVIYEPRHFCKPDPFDDWQWNEAVVDQANVHVKNIGGIPLSIKAGRQDIAMNDGWLVLDGTPLDGGRTIFFDAVRTTLELKEAKTTIDAIYVDNKGQESGYIHPMGHEDRNTAEDDSNGVIINVSNKSLPKTQIDGYYIYKHDNPSMNLGRNFPAGFQQEAAINTFGGRVAGEFGEHWKYRSESAVQIGEKERFGCENRDLCAFGSKNALEYYLKDKLNNNFRTGYEFLSGDAEGPDGSGTDHGFDILWGRWPQFSEILANTWALETRPAGYSNMHRINFGWSFWPVEKQVEVCTDYNLLFANQNTYHGVNPGSFGEGNFRGQLLACVVKYKVNDHISMHWWGEVFVPGDYYTDFRNDAAVFARYEVVFSW